MWVSLLCRRSPWGRWRWAAWCSWRSTSWLSPTVSEPLHSNWNDVSWRNPKDICVLWEFLYLGCCSGLRREPFNNRLSLGVIRNAHCLKHAQLFRVKLFTVLKRECCFWHHRFLSFLPQTTSSTVLKRWSTSLILAPGTYDVSHSAFVPTTPACCLLTANPPPALRPRALHIDYSN